MSSYNSEEEVWKLPEQDFTWDVASELALYQVSYLLLAYNILYLMSKKYGPIFIVYKDENKEKNLTKRNIQR